MHTNNFAPYYLAWTMHVTDIADWSRAKSIMVIVIVWLHK